MPTTCLVTGSEGFLGRHLVDDLVKRGCRVVRHVRSTGQLDESAASTGAFVEFELGKDRISTQSLVGIDVVYHLAAVAHVNILKDEKHFYQRVNVEGTRTLLESSRRAGVSKFIYVSSTKAAGAEDTSTGKDFYGASKLQAEQLVLEYGKLYNMSVSIVRPSLIYGVGVKGNLDRMIKAIIDGRYPPLPDFHNQRSMVSVQDTVKALILSADYPDANGKVYTLSDSQTYNPREIYEFTLEILGRQPNALVIPRVLLVFLAKLGDLCERLLKRPVGFNTNAYQKLSSSEVYSSSLIESELGWAAQETLYDLLPSMIDFIRHSIGEPKR